MQVTVKPPLLSTHWQVGFVASMHWHDGVLVQVAGYLGHE
jgi:hypothetical protein